MVMSKKLVKEKENVMLKATSTEREQAKIRYTLQAVPPKARKDATSEGPYAAHVEIRPASLKSIAAQMVREGSKYSEAEILAITTQLMETVAYRLANGESVNLGSTVRLKPAIRGVFPTLDTPFDASQHKVVVSATIGANLRKVIQQASVVQVDRVVFPKLTQVLPFDMASAKGATFNFIVRGKHLAHPVKGGSLEWFIRTTKQERVVQPVDCDQQKALFQLKLKDYPLDTVFQIGLRIHLQDKAPVEILYPKEIVVR